MRPSFFCAEHATQEEKGDYSLRKMSAATAAQRRRIYLWPLQCALSGAARLSGLSPATDGTESLRCGRLFLSTWPRIDLAQAGAVSAVPTVRFGYD